MQPLRFREMCCPTVHTLAHLVIKSLNLAVGQSPYPHPDDDLAGVIFGINRPAYLNFAGRDVFLENIPADKLNELRQNSHVTR